MKNITTMRGEFVPVEWKGKNTSGVSPIGDRVLVLPDQAAKQTAGGILLPDDTAERTALAAESGVLVALGDDAFAWNSDRSRRFEGAKPKPGDRVYFNRYSGVHVTGEDNNLYWIMSDHCIGAVRASKN